MGTEPGEMSNRMQAPGFDDAFDDARIEPAPEELADQETEQIRGEIETTRADLAETVNAIQEKLNPQRLKEEAVSTVREATVGRVEEMADDAKWKVKGAGYTVIDTIKRNPVPAALAAIGLGWLFMEGRGGSPSMGRQQYRGYESGGRYRADARSAEYPGFRSYPRQGGFQGYEGYDQGSGMGERASQAVQGVREGAGQAVQDVREGAGQVVQDVREGAGQAVQGVQQAAGNVAETAKEGVQQVADEAQWRAQQAKNQISRMLDNNPLMIGAAALALGAVVGFAFPVTEKESEIMGQARDNLVERASEMASETMHKVQKVAEEAGTAAKDAAKEAVESENLTGNPK